MRRAAITAALLLATTLATAWPLKPTPQIKPKSHGNALSGTVTGLDESRKTFDVRNAAGKQTTLVRTDATRLQGGILRVGDRVAVRWLERDRKKIATSIRIEPPAVASVTATPTAAGQNR